MHLYDAIFHRLPKPVKGDLSPNFLRNFSKSSPQRPVNRRSSDEVQSPLEPANWAVRALRRAESGNSGVEPHLPRGIGEKFGAFWEQPRTAPPKVCLDAGGGGKLLAELAAVGAEGFGVNRAEVESLRCAKSLHFPGCGSLELPIRLESWTGTRQNYP